MNTTDNFDLKLYEGSDKFNPLLVENDNTEVIDGILYEQQGQLCEPATELKSGSVHAITRTKGEAPLFRFTATSNWTAGDTMTVDGTQVSAFLTSGEALGTGAYVIGTEVIAAIVGTRVTIYCMAGTVTEADNALHLGGEAPEYYGTAEDVATANSLAQAANTIAQAAQTQVTQLNSDLAKKQNKAWVYVNYATTSTGAISVNLSNYSEAMLILKSDSANEMLASNIIPLNISNFSGYSYSTSYRTDSSTRVYAYYANSKLSCSHSGFTAIIIAR